MKQRGGEVVRFADYERRSLNPDACEPRNPADAAVIIVLPSVKVERINEPVALR